MYEKILVPLDGSMEAESVLSQLEVLLRLRDADVILFQSVYLPIPPTLNQAGGLIDDLERDTTDYLERIRRRLEGEGAKVQVRIGRGAPAIEIIRAADESGATMICMGTHGRSGFVRWMIGSVTEEVLRRSRIPVWVVGVHPSKAPPSGEGNRSILVPFDGTEESLCIAPLAIESARLLGAGIAVLRVEEGNPGANDLGFVGLRMDGPASLEGQDLTDRDLMDAGNRFVREGLRTTLFRVRGETASRINHLARVLPADLIVMASHGRRGLARAITGSVAEEVVRASEIPVIVKRIGAEAPAAATKRRVS
jgi:nucleotide-binding universal stress UspA family protein